MRRSILVVAMVMLLLAVDLVPRSAFALSATGTSRWVFLPCRFQDSPAEPFVTAEKLRNYISHQRGLEVYFAEISNGKLSIEGDVQEWKTIPSPSASVNPGSPADMLEACTRVHDADVDFTRYDAIMLIIDGRGAADLGGTTERPVTLDGKQMYWPIAIMYKESTFHEGVMAHEMLHAYGLPDGFGQSGDGREYDDNNNYIAFTTLHDVMMVPCALAISPNRGQFDGPYGCLPLHPRALYKQRLGWIEDRSVCTFDPSRGSQTFKLETSARSLNDENCLLVRVPIANAPGQYFVAEARMQRGFDAPLYKSGVIMTRTWGDPMDRGNPYYVVTIGPSMIDSLGQTKPDMDGTIHEPGETYTNQPFCFELSVDKYNASREEQSYSVTVKKIC